MTTHDVAALKQLLQEPKKIVITTHRKPDGDALGSSLGLANYLRGRNHDVSVIVPSTYPPNLHWMKGNDDVIIYSKGKKDQITALFNEADLAFCLDCSALHMLLDIGEIFEQSPATKILIDHHLNPHDYTDHVFWDTTAAATAQIIYQLIIAMGDRDSITPDIADCLYAGLMTDTGRFKHPNTTVDVFKTATDLCELGANNAQISRNIYDNNSVQGLQFLGFMLSERLVVLEEFKTAYFYVSPKDFAQFNANSNDTEDLVNYALSLEEVNFAVQMTDLGSKIKFSFRSKGNFSVSNFAAKHFNGGGHKNASGGSSTENLETVRQQFEDLLPLYKEALTS